MQSISRTGLLKKVSDRPEQAAYMKQAYAYTTPQPNMYRNQQW